jgi:hypothetical protein
MSPKTLLLAATLVGSTALVPAFAAAPTPDAGATPPTATTPMPQPPLPLRDKILFSLLDRNGDGAIDQDELATLTKAIFSALDTNGDGKISADEFARALPFAGAGPGMAMGQFMRHGPGPGFGGPGFGHGPWHDHFGMDGHHPNRPDWRQGQLPDDHAPGQQPAELGANPGQPGPAGGAQPDFASLDKNGDGVISPDEFQNGAPVPPPAPQQ